MAAHRLSPARRLLAWAYTGPLGHLYGGLADCAVLLARYGRERLARRRGFGPLGRHPRRDERPTRDRG
jgi:hypothetical protein